jgi:hypothetical protein
MPSGSSVCRDKKGQRFICGRGRGLYGFTNRPGPFPPFPTFDAVGAGAGLFLSLVPSRDRRGYTVPNIASDPLKISASVTYPECIVISLSHSLS